MERACDGDAPRSPDALADDRAAFGRRGEDVAAWVLERKGWRIVERNYRCREGEIDLVAAREGVLAFVEVKARRSRAFGAPAEAVTAAKRRRVRDTALRYLSDRHPGAALVRFDVVDVLFEDGRFRVTHIEGAW